MSFDLVRAANDFLAKDRYRSHELAPHPLPLRTLPRTHKGNSWDCIRMRSASDKVWIEEVFCSGDPLQDRGQLCAINSDNCQAMLERFPSHPKRVYKIVQARFGSLS